MGQRDGQIWIDRHNGTEGWTDMENDRETRDRHSGMDGWTDGQEIDRHSGREMDRWTWWDRGRDRHGG